MFGLNFSRAHVGAQTFNIANGQDGSKACNANVVLPRGPLARVLVTPDDNDLRLRSLTTDGAT